jgi:retron-type reverse transcriptase
MVNSIYKMEGVPAKCKVAWLILLYKPSKDPRFVSSYRPISILPAMSKVWENTFKSAIEKEMGMDPFHRNQFGFRKGKGTIDAISQVFKFADSCRKKGLVCVMMCIYVKNAFNTLRWEVILKDEGSRKLSKG